MDILLIIMGSILIISGLLGCFLPILPGPPLSYFALILLQFTSKKPFTTNELAVLAMATIIVTALDYFVPIWGTKKFGGSKYGVWGSTIGLIAGMFLFPPFGIIIGPFIGALIGELVAGPDINKNTVGVTFMWPEKMMPDPRGGKRLLPFDCKVTYKKQKIKIPIQINDPSDYIPGTKKARIVEKPVWLVEIVMPKRLMSEIRTGAVEMEDQDIDLSELDAAYEQDLDKEDTQSDAKAQDAQQNLEQDLQPVPAA